MNMTHKPILLILCSSFIAGCATVNEAGESAVTVPFITGNWRSSNYSATMQVQNYRQTTPHGEAVWKEAFVYLYHPDSLSSIDGDEVLLEGEVMKRKDFRPSHGLYYHLDTGASRVLSANFDGAFIDFCVRGNEDFEPFADSVRAPTSDLIISTPFATSSITKSAGLTVTWNGSTVPSDALVLEVRDSKLQGFTVLTEDDGLEVIDAGRLGRLSSGSLTVSLTRINYREVRTTDKRTILMGAWTSHEVETRIQE